MEIPTTSNIEALKDFQDVFNEHVRPVAERELTEMPSEYANLFELARGKLIPASIVMDVMLYMTSNLAEMTTNDVYDAKESGDVDGLMSRCHELEPFWKANRSLALSLKVFGQDPANGSDYIPEEVDNRTCYVCGAEASAPLSLQERKACHGGCPECEETLEAVFPK